MGILISEAMRSRIREKARVLSRSIAPRDARQLEELLDALDREEMAEETLERLGRLLSRLEEVEAPKDRQEEAREQQMHEEQRRETNAVRLLIIRQIRCLMQQVLRNGQAHDRPAQNRKR